MPPVTLSIVALGLLASTSMLHGEPVPTSTPTCSASFDAPPGEAPGSPTNLRIIKSPEEESWADQLISGPHAAEFDYGASVNSGPQSYFEELAARADCVGAYSLRSSTEISKYKHGSYAGTVGYDGAMGAAKFHWPNKVFNMTQIRLPIGLTRPGRVLITVDVMWDRGWLTGARYRKSDGSTSRMTGFKFLQVTRDQERIWYEPQQRFIGYEPESVGRFGVRGYNTVYPPTVKGAKIGSWNYGGDNIGPMLADFSAKPDTWTRFYIDVDERASETDRAYISLWVGDETRHPVLILKESAMWSGAGNHGYFWIEWNTSENNPRVDVPMNAWARNVVMLKDVSDPTKLFARPVK